MLKSSQLFFEKQRMLPRAEFRHEMRRSEMGARRFKGYAGPYYDKAIRLLVSGESMESVCVWLKRIRGDDLKFVTISTLLRCCKDVHVRVEQVTKRVEGKLPPQPTLGQAKQQIEEGAKEQPVVAVVEASVPGEEMLPDEARPLFRTVAKAVGLLTSQAWAQLGLSVQMGRIQKMLKTEEGLPMLLPNGASEIKAYADLVEILRKNEVGEGYLKSKLPFGGNPAVGGVLSHAGGPPAPDQKPQWQKDFESLDEVDQNLVREAYAKTIEMVEEQVSGKFKAGRSGGTDPGGTTAAEV